jgi:hypothetical protein
MKWFPGALAIASVAVCLSGCGTICNFGAGLVHSEDEPRIYGGVIRDVEFYEKLDNVVLWPLTPHSNPWEAVVVIGALASEPVLSFAADTLTLPITVYLQHRRAVAIKREACRIAPTIRHGHQLELELETGDTAVTSDLTGMKVAPRPLDDESGCK